MAPRPLPGSHATVLRILSPVFPHLGRCHTPHDLPMPQRAPFVTLGQLLRVAVFFYFSFVPRMFPEDSARGEHVSDGMDNGLDGYRAEVSRIVLESL